MVHRGKSAILIAPLISLAAVIGGCYPTPMGVVSPAPLPLHPSEDAGLHAFGLKDTADRIAASLLADAKLNTGNRSWTLAVAEMNDNTTGKTFGHSYGLLLDRLRETLFEKSNGRVQLIERRAAAHGPEEPGASFPAAAPRDLRPDYVIWGEAWDLPNRGANYYQLQFEVSGRADGAVVWRNTCDVHTKH